MTFADVLSAVSSALSPTAITVLLAALGLSSTAGLRAYLPLLAVGIAGSVPGPLDSHLIPLLGNFQALSNPVVLVILGLLAVGEFTIDKLPIVDHISDAAHTIIRPLSGAMIMAGTQNSLSLTSPWAAAALGGVLALGFHGVKAASRPAVTATTAGIGNPIVSFIEDVLVVVAVLALVLAPIVGIILMVALVIVVGRLLMRTVRRFRGRKGGRQANQPVVVNASPPPKRGRAKRGQVAPGVPRIAAANIPPVVPAPAVAAPVVSAPATPTGPGSSSATTLAATHQPAPYGPPAQAYPPVSPPQSPGMPPQQTQTLPGQWPAQGPYPGDATTLPGSYMGPTP